MARTAKKRAKREKPALHGGPKAKTSPYRTGRRFGREEMKHLREALDQNTLSYHKGEKVQQFCREFAAKYGRKYAIACTSGTAAIHVALCAAGVTAGDEVITSVLTDAGSVIPTLYQNAVPIFADIDPRTYNVTAETIEARITPRTKAILVVHLAGNPAEMDPIVRLARRRKIHLIEDCAQTWNGFYKGRLAGTFGEMGCFSMNDYKHLSVGDGGAVLTDSPRLARLAQLYADKCYSRNLFGLRTGRASRFLAPNYRMSELCGAVAIAQLHKVDWICERRNKHGKLLTRLIEDIPGILPPKVTDGAESSNWYYMLRVDEKTLGCRRDDFVEALQAEGVPAAFYLKRTDQLPMLRNKAIYPPREDGFVCPYDLPVYEPGRITYRKEDCPNVGLVCSTALIIQMREFYTQRDIRETAEAIRKVASYYLDRKASGGQARRSRRK